VGIPVRRFNDKVNVSKLDKQETISGKNLGLKETADGRMSFGKNTFSATTS